MKPTVHYMRESSPQPLQIGAQAYIYVMDHPRKPFPHSVRTSTILNCNNTTGEFETLNTLYKPHFLSD